MRQYFICSILGLKVPWVTANAPVLPLHSSRSRSSPSSYPWTALSLLSSRYGSSLSFCLCSGSFPEFLPMHSILLLLSFRFGSSLSSCPCSTPAASCPWKRGSSGAPSFIPGRTSRQEDVKTLKKSYETLPYFKNFCKPENVGTGERAVGGAYWGQRIRPLAHCRFCLNFLQYLQ